MRAPAVLLRAVGFLILWLVLAGAQFADLPAGSARDAFTAYASLMPGTLPVTAEAGGTLLIHCLDAGQPIAQQMADEEARFIRMLGGTDA